MSSWWQEAWYRVRSALQRPGNSLITVLVRMPAIGALALSVLGIYAT